MPARCAEAHNILSQNAKRCALIASSAALSIQRKEVCIGSLKADGKRCTRFPS